MKVKWFVCIGITAIGSGICSAGPMPSFRGIGELAGGDAYSNARGVSADGSFVVGFSYSASGKEAILWSNGTGLVGLGANTSATGVSSDGKAVAGSWGSTAARWTEGSGWVSIGTLSGYSGSHATDISDDGNVVVGYAGNLMAFRWNEAEGIVNMGTLGGTFSSANGVSADGSVIVGYSNHGNTAHDDAFRWTEATGMVGLGDVPGGTRSYGYGVSADGAYVVGYATDYSSGTDTWWDAFLWHESTGMISLGELPGGDPKALAQDVSLDGSAVVGYSYSDSGLEAFLWDPENGMRGMKSVLTTDYGLDLSGWTLSVAQAISDDGRVIVGYGRNPSGNTEGWIATVPEPGSAALLVFTALALVRRRRRA